MSIESVVTAYLILGTSLEKTGLIDNKWNERKVKNRVYEDTEVVSLFKVLDRLVFSIPLKEREKYAKKANKAIDAIPEDERYGNDILVACNLLLIAVSDAPGPSAKLIESKSTRIIDMVYNHVIDEAGADVVKHSFYVADNLWRYFNGRAILNDEVRALVSKRWMKHKKENTQ